METEFTAELLDKLTFGVKPYSEIKDKRVLNYQVITDPIALQQFIDWLPVLEPYETYYLTLLARNKYCKDISHIKSDRQQLKRITTTKEKMIEKIKQMECPLGCYKQGETEIPQEALALYIHPNPRSQILAMRTILKDGLDLALLPYSNYNVHQKAMSAIQGARSRKLYFDFDYDCLPLELFKTEALNKVINQEAVSILKTRGGFHAIVTLDRIAEQFSKTWYNGMKELAWEDEAAPSGDLLMPVPGCTQGEFSPFFITLDGVEQ